MKIKLVEWKKGGAGALTGLKVSSQHTSRTAHNEQQLQADPGDPIPSPGLCGHLHTHRVHISHTGIHIKIINPKNKTKQKTVIDT